MSATWCAGSPTNEYAGQGGHWYDPAGIAAPKPVTNCVCPADVEIRRTRRMKIIGGQSLTLDTRSMLPVASGTCDGGDCDRRAVTFAYCSTGYAEGRDGLIPVCRRHLLVYRIGKGGTGLWQAEDEFAELRFARRSRWRWLAQWRILLDQRAAVAGRESRGQRRLRLARDVEVGG